MRTNSTRYDRDTRDSRPRRNDRYSSSDDDEYSYDYEYESAPSRGSSRRAHAHESRPRPRGYASEYYDSFDDYVEPPSSSSHRPPLSTTSSSKPQRANTEDLVFSVLKRISKRGNSSNPHRSESEVLRSVTKVIGGPKGALAFVLAEWIWKNYDTLLPVLMRGMEYVQAMVALFLGIWKKKKGVDAVRGFVDEIRKAGLPVVDKGGRVVGEVEEEERGPRREARRTNTTRW